MKTTRLAPSQRWFVVAVAGLALLVFAGIGFLPRLWSSVRMRLLPEVRFLHQSQEYYAKVARAGDAVLLQHPLGTNEVLRLTGADVLLPPIIQELEPRKLLITPAQLHITVGTGRTGFGIVWAARSDRQTNVWELSANSENGRTVVFTQTR